MKTIGLLRVYIITPQASYSLKFCPLGVRYGLALQLDLCIREVDRNDCHITAFPPRVIEYFLLEYINSSKKSPHNQVRTGAVYSDSAA